VEVGTAFVADAQSFELVEPGEGALDDPAGLAWAGSVGDAASGDEGLDAALPQPPTVLVVVIAAVGKQPLGLAARLVVQQCMDCAPAPEGLVKFVYITAGAKSSIALRPARPWRKGKSTP
jgi:hypothetical protein